jgi:alpha-galactosidase
MAKIAFIGAGSVEFTRELLGDLLAFDELADTHIALHDIREDRRSGPATRSARRPR